MENILKGLQPELLWRYFAEICNVPRPSKKEEKIREYIVSVAKKLNLECQVDAIGNVLVRKPATPGYENRQTVVLQSHMDMVCEKNSDTVHDFDNDPIKPYIANEWVKAQGTTLGADDGIGVAAQLALMEDKTIEHGPLEILVTVDEETGLTGAFNLQPDFLKGRILLNLDSEDEGELFIGCAGGEDSVVTMAYQKEAVPADTASFLIKVFGLKGGHSGDDINKGLGNANKIINRLLYAAQNELGLRLSELKGGNLRNAIAREAFAKVVVPANRKDDFLKMAKEFNTTVKTEFRINEPQLEVTVEPAEQPAFVMSHDSQLRLINSLYACPHGVIAMSAEIPNFVETSTNLAAIRFRDNEIEITTSQRSSGESGKRDVVNMVTSVFELAGAKVVHGDGYPGWAPNANSVILDITRNCYQKLFKKEPKVLAIHAGLECGLIGEKFPGMDMISYGPTIKGAHSPDERLLIETVDMFWKLTLEVLKNIPTEKQIA